MAPTDIDRLRHTAIHEAGHAVAHVRLALDDGPISIDPPGHCVMDTAEGEGAEHVWDAAHVLPVAIAYCAGYAALIAAGYGEDDACLGTFDDFDKASDIAEHWDLPTEIAAWKAQAVELMHRPENVAAVALVAQHLLVHRLLDSDWVARLVELADGDMTEAEFAQYVCFRGYPRRAP